MKLEPRTFLKERADGDRERLDFSSIVEHCPELAGRIAILRSFVKRLKLQLRSDSMWALGKFNRLTTGTVIVALAVAVGSIIAIYISGTKPAAAIAVALGTVVAAAAAATQAFGWHKRYHALFRARWALAALEIRIDHFVCNMAHDHKEGSNLTEEERVKLATAVDGWLQQLDVALYAFGDSYGAAIQDIKIKEK